MLRSQKGFTLVELLIVIVIIGILAGVLIAIIDPAAQQNRARDAGVKATMNKVALATQGYISAYGDSPEGDEFLLSLENRNYDGADCAAGGYVCTFGISGNDLPALCSANNWSGTGTDQCYYHYVGNLGTGSQFQIYARSFGIADTLFGYDNTAGEIVECSLTAVCP